MPPRKALDDTPVSRNFHPIEDSNSQEIVRMRRGT
jgi:hypothetical protein